jgi:hypothetical protein
VFVQDVRARVQPVAKPFESNATLFHKNSVAIGSQIILINSHGGNTLALTLRMMLQISTATCGAQPSVAQPKISESGLIKGGRPMLSIRRCRAFPGRTEESNPFLTARRAGLVRAV